MIARGWCLGIALCFAVAARANAQSAEAAPLVPAVPVAVAGPAATDSAAAALVARGYADPIAVRRPAGERSEPPTDAPQNFQKLGQPKALMITGSAAFILGAIIGGKPGTFIMAGGTVAALYGLYKYVQ